MHFLRDTGFVIKRINFGEADRFITLFTKDNGKMEVVARGVRKISSKRASYTELLTLINFQAIKTSKNYILTEVQQVRNFEATKSSLEKIGVLFFICELVDRLCPDGQKHADIYNLIFQTLLNIEKQENAQHISDFQLEMLSLLGFWDRKRKFEDEDDLKNFIEGIIEKKLKARNMFRNKIS